MALVVECWSGRWAVMGLKYLLAMLVALGLSRNYAEQIAVAKTEPDNQHGVIRARCHAGRVPALWRLTKPPVEKPPQLLPLDF